MYKKMNLQLFADGGEGGSGAQGGNAGGNGNSSNNGQGAGSAGQGAAYTYQQAEEIATARAERAEKSALKSFFQQQGMSEAEVSKAMADFKAQKAASQPDADKLQRELADANAKLQRSQNEKLLTSKHVRTEDIDYVLFKAEKLVTDKVTFEQAVDQFLKDNPRYKEGGTYRVATGTSTGGSAPGATGNETINNMIRNSFGRK